MSGRGLRTLLLLLLVGGAAYWIYRARPTVAGLVDDITRPLFSSKAAVKESEHKRLEAEAMPVMQGDIDVAIGMLKEKMSTREVRELLGSPDETEEIREEGKPRVRWTYRRAARTLVFEDGRLLSIAVR